MSSLLPKDQWALHTDRRRRGERESSTPAPLLARLILGRPEAILERLEAAVRCGVIDVKPNPWQLSLGVLRMWARVLFRTDTVGTNPGGTVRTGWRARLLANRAVRLPALLWEGAVQPLDFTGLASNTDQLIRHLLAAHHQDGQIVYDLEILSCHPGGLEALVAIARAVAHGDHPRAAWWRDLVVFRDYHETLLDAAQRAQAGGVRVDLDAASDPDRSFFAAMRWCARQPATPRATFSALLRRQLNLGPDPVPL